MALRAEPTGSYPESVLIAAGRRPARSRRSAGRWREARLAYAILTPSLLVILGLVAYPFFAAIYLSFQHKIIGAPARFAGWANYLELFRDDVFVRTAYNSVVYTGVSVAIKFVLGLTMALILDQERRFNVQFYAAGGHLLDLTDVVDKMRREPKGIFESSMTSVLYKGRAMGAPLAVNPWPMHARLDLLEKAKVEYPKTWEEFVETSKKIQDPPRLFAFGICLGLAEDTTDNVMNILWCYGGKTVEADSKTVVMNSPENLAGVKLIEGMFKTHKIIAPGSISWDNAGNNKAYQSKQAAFVMNPASIYAYLDGNDKDLQKATGLFPVPAGPKGTVNQIDTWALGAFKKNPYPELAKGLIDYMMQPANYDKIIQSTGGRWVPVYKRLFDSPFWREKPAFAHFIRMAETGVPVSYAGAPTPAAGEVLNTDVVPKMIQRVLVENWPAEKALEECHKKIAEIYTRNSQG